MTPNSLSTTSRSTAFSSTDESAVVTLDRHVGMLRCIACQFTTGDSTILRRTDRGGFFPSLKLRLRLLQQLLEFGNSSFLPGDLLTQPPRESVGTRQVLATTDLGRLVGPRQVQSVPPAAVWNQRPAPVLPEIHSAAKAVGWPASSPRLAVPANLDRKAPVVRERVVRRQLRRVPVMLALRESARQSRELRFCRGQLVQAVNPSLPCLRFRGVQRLLSILADSQLGCRGIQHLLGSS